MDSLFHAHTKLIADATTAKTTSRPASDGNDANGPPPAYATAVNVVPGSGFDHEQSIDPGASDITDLDEGEEEENTEPKCLDIDASTTIHGSQNIIAIQPVDGPRITALLVSLLQGQANTQAYAQQQPRPPPTLPTLLHGHKINVRIDCGVRIVGDRNVLGGPGIIRPKTNGANGSTSATAAGPHAPATTMSSTTTSGAATAPYQKLETHMAVGNKRKADDEVAEEPELKRIDVNAGADVEG
ncbi:uncharacterized protein K452DRAFT_315841 [Aplosporella prunicola CBS 121167]|uniref:Uncharacterized protein n=1 Tax=Aplosporella prunicola CBS 121167 TaxID=1176127 RepID=A0A6A6BQE0_9PEZI|nr:uncharacterized protein K452DRAFT_315841 [Aplosporella prunicola CBS 121167]KAF2145643.1 hypothetical protein K452DRAFT_315841 [Aplosporella prunicola CBS 121167]